MIAVGVVDYGDREVVETVSNRHRYKLRGRMVYEASRAHANTLLSEGGRR
jgi:hypothetical protein